MKISSTEYFTTVVTFHTLHRFTYFLVEVYIIFQLSKDLYDIELFDELKIIHGGDRFGHYHLG